MTALRTCLATCLLLGMTLGCTDSGLGDKWAPPPPVDAPYFGFGWYFPETETTAGSTGILWGVACAPAGNGPFRWYLNGPGSLRDYSDLQKVYVPGSEVSSSAGNYIPPADVPPEGLTVTIGVDVRRPASVGGRPWDRSPDFPVRVVRRTDPMLFEYRYDMPKGLTFKPGESYSCLGLLVRPAPLDFKPVGTLIPSRAGADPGTLVVPAPDRYVVNWTYTAPATVTEPMDVTVRISGWDPWAKQQRTVDYVLHLVK